MRKYSQTSSCWNYFEKVEGGAKCMECNKVIACFGNTSNLVKHLRRLHKNLFNSCASLHKRNRKDSSDYEGTEGEGAAPSEEEHSESIAETSSAVHTIQAYRDANGTTFLYLQPASEGEAAAQIQNAQLQPVVASSESLIENGEIVSVAVQKDPSLLEGQAVDGGTKTQEEATPRRLVHAPVKNHQGSSLPARAIIRQVNRPSPVKTASSVNSSNNNSFKEDTYDAFGKYIASMLRNLPSKTACKLQGEIVNWILKEQMKNNNS